MNACGALGPGLRRGDGPVGRFSMPVLSLVFYDGSGIFPFLLLQDLVYYTYALRE